MSMGTPMEIFTGGVAAGAQSAGPHIVGAATGIGSGASAQQTGDLAEGVGSRGEHN